METISRATHRAFLIRCSYVEIYKEQITDLLGKKTLEVHESKLKVRRRLYSASARRTAARSHCPRAPHARIRDLCRACILTQPKKSFLRRTKFSQRSRAVRRRVTLAARE